MGECLQHRLLHRVFGVLFVVQNCQSRGVEAFFVGPDQFVEQFFLPMLHVEEQILL